MTTISILPGCTISTETRKSTEIVVKVLSCSPVGIGFWFRSWAFRATRNLLFLLLLFPWIIIIFLCVYWYDWFFWYATFADRTDHHITRLVHPGVDARPTVQMTALAHNGLPCLIQTYVTLEMWSTWFRRGTASFRLCTRCCLWLFTFFCCQVLSPDPRWGLMCVLLRGM